jgi:hypothetical protein
MDFATAITTLNALLTSRQPTEFNSSWIRTHAPRCYRFFQRNVRREYGGIDWDRVTVALERKFQRLWKPARSRPPRKSYEDLCEIEAILKKHPGKLYVFISPRDKNDQQIADVIGISFVRLAQRGNLLARQQLCDLIRFTVDAWIEQHETIARWSGREAELQSQLTACIRLYRYTGSFLTYLFRTLEYAGRGLARPRVFVRSSDVLNGRVFGSCGLVDRKDKPAALAVTVLEAGSGRKVFWSGSDLSEGVSMKRSARASSGGLFYRGSPEVLYARRWWLR